MVVDDERRWRSPSLDNLLQEKPIKTLKFPLILGYSQRVAMSVEGQPTGGDRLQSL